MAHAAIPVYDVHNFDVEVLQADLPVLVVFSASWCGPCKVQAPIAVKLAEELAGSVKVGKLDIDETPSLAATYGVKAVPTTVLFKGGQPVGRQVGLANKTVLTGMIQGS